MKLIVSFSSSKVWQALYPSVQAFNVESLDAISSVSEDYLLLTSLLDSTSEQLLKVIASAEIVSIFYQQAEYWVHDAVCRGERVSDALVQWQNITTTVLKIKKMARRKCQLININQLAIPKKPEKVLATLIGANVDILPQIVDVDPYRLLLAKQAVEQSSLKQLNDLIFASSEVVVENSGWDFNIQKLLDDDNSRSSTKISTVAESKILTKELVTAHEKMENLSETILKLKEELNKVNLKKNSIERLNKEISLTHKKVLDNESAANKILRIENRSAIEKSNNVNELQLNLRKERERIKLKNEKLHDFSQKMKRYRRDIAELNVSLANEKSTSQNLINDKNAMNTDVNILKETLVKERLASEKLVSDKASFQSESLINQKKLQRELKATKKEMSSLMALNAQDTQKLIQLESEISRIKSSLLWKTTAPIRVISKAMSKKDGDSMQLQQDLALLLSSNYFDIKWYLKMNPDVAASGVNPAEHYLKFGAKEGRTCSPSFDANWYLNKYPDVNESGMNPLLHFIRYGEPEGRQASPKLLALNSRK